GECVVVDRLGGCVWVIHKGPARRTLQKSSYVFCCPRHCSRRRYVVCARPGLWCAVTTSFLGRGFWTLSALRDCLASSASWRAILFTLSPGRTSLGRGC